MVVVGVVFVGVVVGVGVGVGVACTATIRIATIIGVGGTLGAYPGTIGRGKRSVP